MSDLTRQQLCAALQVSESTVRRLEQEGMPWIPSDSPRRKLYSLEAVKAWARRDCAKPPPSPPQPVKPSEPAWLTDPAARAFFGLDLPRPEWTPHVPLTPKEKRAKLKAEELQRKEDRRALVTFHATKRRSAKLKRTPPWANLDAMRAIYAAAQRLTQETGIPHHVDHFYPLQGDLVSGLHVPNNLQILTGSENSKKRNRFPTEPSA